MSKSIVKTIDPKDSYTYDTEPDMYIFNKVFARQERAIGIACDVLADRLLICPEERDLTRCIDDCISCKDCWHKWLLEKAGEEK